MSSDCYQPVSHVVTDGEGHFIRVDVCCCTPGNEGDDLSCLVHYAEPNGLRDDEFVSETVGGDL